MKRIILVLVSLLMNAGILLAQETKIDVFPAAPYDRFIIYQTLAIFWVGIIGLIIIIRMKLKEIERIQSLGIDKEDKDTPLLD
ncbi:MAG TPA: hypothetical protein DDW17_02545 [Deltaproteobacteria bacterium]|nr:hypothetical protein [Deltaproteobacteria bacterium]